MKIVRYNNFIIKINNNCYNIFPENKMPKSGDYHAIFWIILFYSGENNLLDCFPSGIICEKEEIS